MAEDCGLRPRTALGPHLVQFGFVHSSVAVERRSLGGRVFLDETEPERCNGFRGLFWLLFLRSSPIVGRLLIAGLDGGTGAASTGAVGGLCDFALGPESALLMVAAVWLEYPESLWRSLLRPTFSGVGVLSEPRSDGWERLAATLALAAGERRKLSMTLS